MAAQVIWRAAAAMPRAGELAQALARRSSWASAASTGRRRQIVLSALQEMLQANVHRAWPCADRGMPACRHTTQAAGACLRCSRVDIAKRNRAETLGGDKHDDEKKTHQKPAI